MTHLCVQTDPNWELAQYRERWDLLFSEDLPVPAAEGRKMCIPGGARPGKRESTEVDDRYWWN